MSDLPEWRIQSYQCNSLSDAALSFLLEFFGSKAEIVRETNFAEGALSVLIRSLGHEERWHIKLEGRWYNAYRK
jgi:hypothetical protein